MASVWHADFEVAVDDTAGDGAVSAALDVALEVIDFNATDATGAAGAAVSASLLSLTRLSFTMLYPEALAAPSTAWCARSVTKHLT